MNYLKTYENYETIIQDVMDILLPLSDDDIEIKEKMLDKWIFLSFYREKGIELFKYRDDIDRLVDYLKHNGYDFRAYLLNGREEPNFRYDTMFNYSPFILEIYFDRAYLWKPYKI